MTHSSHRFSTLSADDVALCRAHSEAIASEPDCVVWARVTDTKASLAELNRKVAYRAACDDFERVTLNQAQSDAYWQWQREVHAPVTIGFDLGAPEGDTTVIALATAKPSAPEAPFPAPPQLPPVPGLALSDLHAYIRDRLASTSSADGAALIGERPAEPRTIPVPWDQWHEKAMRDMVKPAQQPEQKESTHSVCIKAHKSLGFNRDIGTVLPLLPHRRSHPEYWLPCDESGWVTHAPTADAVCPVPAGVRFETLRRDGSIAGDDWTPPNAWELGYPHSREPVRGDIIAWRPIAQS